MLVIFDCDGVLIDSEIVAARHTANALTTAGFPITADDLIVRFAGLTDEEMFRRLEAESDRRLPEDFAKACAEEVDRLLGAVEIVPGAEDVLDRLEGPRAVCSNSSSARLKVSLEAVGLWDRLMPDIFSAREVGDGTPKPSPNVYLHAAATTGNAPAETIVIEDSVHGVIGAKAAGMRVIGFIGASHSWPGHGEALMEAGAETVVRRLVGVLPVIAALREWQGLPD
jgi:HAD superfamily hydrolase (TIGR01509 family)